MITHDQFTELRNRLKNSGLDAVTFNDWLPLVQALELALDATKGKFVVGDRVRKTRGASWQGHICGFYKTELTETGYAVESEREKGSVQIYPESALEKVP